MARQRIATLLLMTLCCANGYAAENAQRAANSGVEWQKDLVTARKSMSRLQRPMILFLTAPGCVYCEVMKKDVFTQPWIQKEITRKYIPVIVNGREQKSITTRLKVRSYPVFAIVHPDGKVVDVVRGYKSGPEFVKAMAVAKAKLQVHTKLIASKKSSDAQIK